MKHPQQVSHQTDCTLSVITLVVLFFMLNRLADIFSVQPQQNRANCQNDVGKPDETSPEKRNDNT